MGFFDWFSGKQKKSTKKQGEDNKIVKKQPLQQNNKKEKDKKVTFSNDSLKAAVKEWLDNSSNAKKKYGHISEWNVSQVTDMEELFCEAESFNEDIGNWDVSNVENMTYIFFSAESFNQDIGNWDVSNVRNMWNAFYCADSFNQDISNWDVSNVKKMSGMFARTKSFNQDIGKWNVSNVEDMSAMFEWVESFNQDIGNWDVSNVENMDGMFTGVESFKQDLSKWNLISMDGELERTIEHLNSHTTKKIELSTEAESRLLKRGQKDIELNVSGVKIPTTIAKFENAKDFEDVVKYHDENYDLNLTSNFEAISDFFKEITDKKLVFTAEHSVSDEELGDMLLEEICFVNCECPESLKKYYNGECFLIKDGELLETSNDIYKKIDFDELWDTAYISNSGVECAEYSDYLKHI